MTSKFRCPPSLTEKPDNVFENRIQSEYSKLRGIGMGNGENLIKNIIVHLI